MPPTFNSLTTAAASAVKWAMGGLQGKDNQTDDPNAATNKEDADDVQEVGEEAVTGNKRGRTGSDGGSGRAGKKQVLGQHDSRLIQYDRPTPKDATALSFPGTGNHNYYDPQQDWNPIPQHTSQNRMPTRHPRGHRPIDTLGKSTPHSGKNNDAGRIFKQYAVDKASPRQLQTQASRGSNVPHKSDFPDDHPQSGRPTKRQKTTNTTVSRTIDLTDDDQTFGQPVGRQKDQTYARSQLSGSELRSKTIRHDGITQSFEQNSVNALLDLPTDMGNQAQSSDAHFASSHASGKSSQKAKSINGDGRRSPTQTRKPSVVVLDDDEAKSAGPIAGSLTRQSRGQRNPLAIDLDKGTNEYVAAKTQKIHGLHVHDGQGRQQDMNGIHGAPRADCERAKSTRAPQPPQAKDNPRRRITSPKPANNGHTDERVTAVDPSTKRLANTFHRLESPEKQQKSVKLKDNMLSTSASNRASLTSEEDVISGETTVRSANSRNGSPHKSNCGGPRPSTKSDNARAAGSFEPSGSKPTPYTRGGKPLAESQAPQRLQDVEETRGADEVRVPVRAIFCKSCVLSQKGLELLWEPELSSFVVVCKKLKMRTPSNASLITIGRREVNSWTEAKDLLCVLLRGPSSEISTGRILIEFEDDGGMSTCHDYLEFSIKSLQHTHVSSDTMRGTLQTQAREQQMAYKKLQETLARPRSLVQDNHKSRRIGPSPEPEEIKYEQDDEPERPRLKARDRMQGGTLAQVLNSDGFQDPRESHEQHGTISKFFDPPRRSTRQSKPVPAKERTPSPVKWTKVNEVKEWPHSVVYPEEGLRRVTVDFQDLERLDEGEFLNDNVVNFELRWIEEHMAPEHRSKVHFFNTYFFSSLSHKNGRKDFNYEAVQRWTKKTDLFNIPYIVVPINVELHWFVAIICNLPNVKRKFAGFEGIDMDSEDKPPAVDDDGGQDFEAEKEAEAPVEDHHSAKDGGEQTGEIFEFDDDGRVSSAQTKDTDNTPLSSRPSTATKRKPKKKKAPAMRKYDTSEPIIMSLDSFSITRSAEIKYLKLYVSAEAKSKREMDLEYNDLKGMSAKGIPEQPNFCDCGLYLLGYVEEFAKDPDSFVRKVLTRELDRENDFADFDASAKRSEIRTKLLDLQAQQEDERLARKRAKKAGQTAKSQKDTPAVTPKPANVQTSTAQKAAWSPPARPMASAKKTAATVSLSQLVNDSRSRKQADDREDDLEVVAPNFAGQSKDEDNSPAGNDDDDDEEMLMDELKFDASETGAVVDASQSANDIYKLALPIPTSAAKENRTSPLTHLERLNNQSLDDDEPKIIDIGDEESEAKEAEVPDSQETSEAPRGKKGRKLYF